MTMLKGWVDFTRQELNVYDLERRQLMTLWRDKIRGVWRYSFQYHKKVHSGPGYKLKSSAAQAEADHRKRIKEAPTIQTGMGFEAAANHYLDYAELRFAKKTFKYKRYVYQRFIKAIGDMALADITPHIVHNYLATRRSNHNYNVHRKEIGALFSFCINHLEVMEMNPVRKIEKLPVNPEPKDVLTEQQVLQLLMVADPETEKPLLQVTLYTLGRIDEILRMKWEDIKFEQRTVTLWTRKRKGGRYEADVLPMIQDLYDVLWRLWVARGQNLWVFYNGKTETRYIKRPKMMRSLCKRAGVPYFGFHAIRHFMASFLADSEKQSTKTVQKILRHKSPKTTERYMHSDDRNVVEAMRSIEGKFR